MPISDGVAAAARPLAEPRPEYRMMVHPERWGVIAGQVVPIVGHLHLQGGVNQMKAKPDGSHEGRYAIAAAEERGWMVLDEVIDGIQLCQEKAPGVWVSHWERLYPGSSQVTSNTAAYVKWLREQIDAGVIPAPRPYVLERLIESKRRESLTLADAVRTQPSRQPELDRAQADLAALEQELARINEAPEPPAPTKPSKRRIGGGE